MTGVLDDLGGIDVDILSIGMASGAGSVTASEAKTYSHYHAKTCPSSGGDLPLPAVKWSGSIGNDSASDGNLIVSLGTVSFSLAPGAEYEFEADGTANGLAQGVALGGNSVVLPTVDLGAVKRAIRSVSLADGNQAIPASALSSSNPLIRRYLWRVIGAKGESGNGDTVTLNAVATSFILGSEATNTVDIDIVLGTTVVTLTPGEVRFFTLDGTANGMTAQPVEDIAVPSWLTDAAQAAAENYLAENGLQIRTPVLVVATSNITLSGAQTIDGVPVSDGDRVLPVGQTLSKENGPYDVNSSGAWTRSSDGDSWDDLKRSSFAVRKGSHTQSVWVAQIPADGIINTDAVAFQEFIVGPNFSDDTPQPASAGGSPGTSPEIARGDHAHPITYANWPIQTGNFNAVAGGKYLINTTGGAVTVTLPLSTGLTGGETIEFADIFTSWGTHAVTFARNGATILGQSADMTDGVDDDHLLLQNKAASPAADWRV